MNKKDRIAIVVSGVYFIFLLSISAVSKEYFYHINYVWIPVWVIFMSLLLVYWVYRFIKGDISFLPGFLKK